MVYPVVEIFTSIQGEGTWMGRPFTFVRLAGCNLRCPWCDTDVSAAGKLGADTIAAGCKDHDVVITGGEPTIHNLRPLIAALRASDNSEWRRYIAIETNGTNPISHAHGVDWIACSPKPGTDWAVHPRCEPDELKYVVDGVWNPANVPEDLAASCAGRIWLQPEASQMQLRLKEAYDICMEDHRFRVGCQLHKFMDVQ